MNSARNVAELIGEMRLTEQALLDEQACLARFLHVYKAVTVHVAKRVRDGQFNNPDMMEEIDLCFASLYDEALRTYREAGEKLSPWKTYFQACEDHNQPIIHVLLGINAHINGDLPVAIRTVSYDNKEDFDAVNDILHDTASDVLSYLASHGDLYGRISQVFDRTFVDEATKIMAHWRRDAWNIAHTSTSKASLHEATEAFAEDLVLALSTNPISHPRQIRGIIDRRSVSDYL